MIVVRLMGGLGNQMFQYAAGRALAMRNNMQLKLDLSWFDTQEKRRFELDLLRIDASIATTGETALFDPDVEKGRLKRMKGRLGRLLSANHYPIIKEKQLFSFDSEMLEVKGHALLIGSWQNESYFKNIRETLLSEFRPVESLKGIDRQIARQIESSESVSAHIRRGDYVSDEKINQFHGCCSMEYYHRGLAKIIEQVARPRVFVFSDDVQWARENFRPEFGTEYVAHEEGVGSHVDIHLMRLCKHNIIANSSYSWWGAWLNENPNKVVVAPARWIASDLVEGRDPIPDQWTKER